MTLAMRIAGKNIVGRESLENCFDSKYDKLSPMSTKFR
jgi:hypothetical protein